MTTSTCYQSPQWLWFKHLVRPLKQSWWMSLLVWLVAIAPAHALLEMRVAVERDVEQVVVGGYTPSVVRDESGQVLAELPALTGLMATADQGSIEINDQEASQIWVEPSGDGFVRIGDRWYRGRVLVVPTAEGLTAVNYVDLEEYLYSVVGSEMPTSWPLEALKAQAVTARSYALFQRQTGANEVFDVGNTTTWQVYKGVSEETPSTQQAVRATQGQVLTHRGEIIQAVFHSSSGGHTENVEDIWSSPLPYLRGVPDFDQGSPVFEWTQNFTAAEMRSRITGVGNIISLTPQAQTPRRRVRSIRVVGDQGSRVMTGSELRNALGLRSTLFTVTPATGRVASSGYTPRPTTFRFSGRGFGHGIGMSQYGALNLARRGWNYRQIVTHYYTGAQLSRIRVQ